MSIFCNTDKSEPSRLRSVYVVVAHEHDGQTIDISSVVLGVCSSKINAEKKVLIEMNSWNSIDNFEIEQLSPNSWLCCGYRFSIEKVKMNNMKPHLSSP